MKPRMIVIAVLAAILALPVALHAQETDPISSVQALHDALNAGDVDAMLSVVADGAVVTVVPPPEGTGVFNGKDEIRAWYEGMVAANGAATVGDCQDDGETVACIIAYTDEGLQAMGVDFIESEWVGIVSDGKFQSYTVTLTPESVAKFPAPPEAMPVTGGPAASNDGSALLLAVGGLAVLGGLGLLRRSSQQQR